MYKLLVVFVTLLIAVFLIRLLRSSKIKEKYVWIWLSLDLLALIAVLLPVNVMTDIAKALGFELASNMVFTVVLAVLVISVIQLSVTVSIFQEQRRRLVEEIAILRYELQELKKSSSTADNTTKADFPADENE